MQSFDIEISVEGHRYIETINPNNKNEWDDFFDDKDPEFIRPLQKFSLDKIDQYNDNHFIFGWWESYLQSGYVPEWVLGSALNEPKTFFLEVRAA